MTAICRDINFIQNKQVAPYNLSQVGFELNIANNLRTIYQN